jgi:IscR-regulated protein YhgI
VRAAFALVASHAVVQLPKRTITRARPRMPEGFAALVQPPDRFSFPSGHAASSLSVALAVAADLPSPAAAALAALAMLVGISRCYLGVHYPRDVIAGWLLARSSASSPAAPSSADLVIITGRSAIEFSSPPRSLWGRGRERGAPAPHAQTRRSVSALHHPITPTPLHPYTPTLPHPNTVARTASPTECIRTRSEPTLRDSEHEDKTMIQLTDDARARIQALVDAGAVRDPALRIALATGEDGEVRSPMDREYAISLVEREDKQKTEIAINLDGIRVLLNLDTSTLLSGATISWSDEDGGFRVETPRPKRQERTVTSTGGAGLSGPLAERVQAVFDELVNPRIAAHGGAVELVDVADDVIYVRMTGGCQGCAASALTLRQGIDRMVREEIPEVRDIVDLTDHEAGANPYY